MDSTTRGAATSNIVSSLMADTERQYEVPRDIRLMVGTEQRCASNMAEVQTGQLKTHRLVQRLSIDTATAFTAAMLVAPAMTIIDQ